MKLILSAAAMLLAFPVVSSTPAFAGCEGFDQDLKALEAAVNPANQSSPKTALFGSEFSSKETLGLWTRTSTAGGGRIEDREFMGRNFVFAYRSYTSGVKSSDAAAYIEDNGHWKLVKANPVVMGQWIEARRQDDEMVFRADSGGDPIMVITKSDITGL